MQIECQFYPDRRELRKWFARCGALNYRHSQRVPLVVLYLKPGRWRKPPNCLDLSEGRLVTRFEFTTLCLWELKDEIRHGSLRILAPLLVLCEDKPTVALLREGRALIHSLDVSESMKADLMGIAIAVGSRFSRRLLMTEFR